jgi:DNA polymerase III subunit alpha
MSEFVHLHAHSTYSILDAWGQPEQIVERVVEAGHTAHALTDHDSTSGHWKFQKAANAAGIKPLFGIEIRVMDDLSQRTWKDAEGRRFYPYHLGLIARNAEGYKNLMQLTTLAWQQGIGGRGKYMPAITWEDVGRHQAGLAGTTGCLSGKLSRAILGQIPDDPADVAAQMEEMFEPGWLFYEWQNIGMDAVAEVAKVLSRKKQSVVTHDVHFPTPDQRESQNIMAALMRWKKVVGPDGQGPMHKDCYLTTADEVKEIARKNGVVDTKALRRAMGNTVDLAEACNVTLPQIAMVRFPHEGDKEHLFRSMMNSGWKKRGLNLLPRDRQQVYIDRAEYEFDIIRQKDYVDYFLIIADICKFCVRQGIMKGPARGSSAGSLLAWLLEITEVDPIRHDLVFERFIDLNRADLPDIDLDFPAHERERIHQYLRDKYSDEKVALVGTFTSFKAKNALDDVARVHEIPYWVPNKIKPYIPERAHGDVRSDLTLVDAMDNFPEVNKLMREFPDMQKAIALEGQYKAMGVHPAGVVVSSAPVEEVAPIYEIPGKGRVIGLDGWDIESVGLVKIDVLGIDGMTLVQNARDAIRANHGIDVDFYNLPLDDPETMRGFTEADVLGIFQFSGKATKNILRQIKPKVFEELVDINTLARPGALLADTTNKYVAIHQGRMEKEPVHPIVDRITESTYNLVLYQEQVLKIMREFGGLSWAEAGEVRKFLSKRMGVEILQKFREQFVDGAERQGIDEDTAIKVWMMTSTFGAYGFNRSHSLSYSMLAYWQMYVKRHYPIEFYYAALANENDADKRDLFIQEAKRKGVAFLPVDPNRSAKTFALEPGGIRYGLTQIKGVGDKTAERLMEARPFADWSELEKVPGVGAKTVQLFREAHHAGSDLFGLKEKEQAIKDIRQETEAWSIKKLIQVADGDPWKPEVLVAGNVISRNFRQQQKFSEQMKAGADAETKSDAVVMYIRDETGDVFPIFVTDHLARRKRKEIWEGGDTDVYLIRGKLPPHGKFLYATGIANTNMQKAGRNNDKDNSADDPTGQLSLAIG